MDPNLQTVKHAKPKGSKQANRSATGGKASAAPRSSNKSAQLNKSILSTSVLQQVNYSSSNNVKNQVLDMSVNSSCGMS